MGFLNREYGVLAAGRTIVMRCLSMQCQSIWDGRIFAKANCGVAQVGRSGLNWGNWVAWCGGRDEWLGNQLTGEQRTDRSE